MKPSKKGWIKDYFSYLMDYVGTKNPGKIFFDEPKQLTQDKKLYKLVQPTGLMYGHPIQLQGKYTPSMTNWADDEKMKLILLDSLVNQEILMNRNKIESRSDLEDCLHESLIKISEFYKGGQIKDDKSKASLFKKNKSGDNTVESIIAHRVKVKSFWNQNFWAGFFQNSLLFLDVYYFGEWLRIKDTGEDFDPFFEQQEGLRLVILQVIAAAAHADNSIEKEEEALFKFFLQSANLKKENELIANKFLNTNLELSTIQLDQFDSWIIKKYILELAILTVWADRNLEASEKQFVKLLATKLGISNPELENSLLATESFVLSNWNKVHFLQSKHDFLIIKDRFSNRFAQIARKNKDAFVQEVNESKELVYLMKKMTRETLSQTEKIKVKAQLLDILKTLPTFVVIALPGTFITLPLLLKLLPKSAFPSAFGEIE